MSKNNMRILGIIEIILLILTIGISYFWQDYAILLAFITTIFGIWSISRLTSSKTVRMWTYVIMEGTMIIYSFVIKQPTDFLRCTSIISGIAAIIFGIWLIVGEVKYKRNKSNGIS